MLAGGKVRLVDASPNPSPPVAPNLLLQRSALLGRRIQNHNQPKRWGSVSQVSSQDCVWFTQNPSGVTFGGFFMNKGVPKYATMMHDSWAAALGSLVTTKLPTAARALGGPSIRGMWQRHGSPAKLTRQSYLAGGQKKKSWGCELCNTPSFAIQGSLYNGSDPSPPLPSPPLPPSLPFPPWIGTCIKSNPSFAQRAYKQPREKARLKRVSESRLRSSFTT